MEAFDFPILLLDNSTAPAAAPESGAQRTACKLTVAMHCLSGGQPGAQYGVACAAEVAVYTAEALASAMATLD